MNVNPGAPDVAIFPVLVVPAILAPLGYFTAIQFVTTCKLRIAIAACAVLFVGCVFKGL